MQKYYFNPNLFVCSVLCGGQESQEYFKLEEHKGKLGVILRGAERYKGADVLNCIKRNIFHCIKEQIFYF